MFLECKFGCPVIQSHKLSPTDTLLSGKARSWASFEINGIRYVVSADVSLGCEGKHQVL